MDTNEARDLAVSLMNQHGLIGLNGWRFKFDRCNRRFGLCSYRYRCISLSRVLTELNPIDEVRDTILHEIAHAIAGPQASHGLEWRTVARRLGARPEACYSADKVITPAAPWQSTCEFCKRVIKRYKLNARIRDKAYCLCPLSVAQRPKVYLKWERTR